MTKLNIKSIHGLDGSSCLLPREKSSLNFLNIKDNILWPPESKLLLLGIFLFLSLQFSPQTLQAQCPYGGANFVNIDATGMVYNTVYTPSTCYYGGEYALLQNAIAGEAYEIWTGNTFDASITVFLEGNTTPLAYNDAFGPIVNELNPASIRFVAPQNGTYRILINRYLCTTQTTCISLNFRKVHPWGGASGIAAVTPPCGTFFQGAAGSGTYTYFNAVQGVNYTVSSCGTSFDTHLSIYSLSGTWTPIVYNNDNGPDCTGTPASLSFNASQTSGNYLAIINRAGNQLNQVGKQIWTGHDFSGTSAVLMFRQNTTVSNTTSTSSICMGETKALTATLGGAHNNPSISWSKISGPGTISGTTFTANGGAGTVTVRATVGSCFSDRSFTVFSNVNNPGTITAPATICQGSSASITNVTAATTGSPASSGPTYQYYWQRTSSPVVGWTQYQTTTSLTSALPVAVTGFPGTYLLRRTSSFGCTGEASTPSISLTVVATSVGGTVSPASQSICEGDNGIIPVIPSLSGNTGSVVRWEFLPPGGSWTNWGGAGSTTAPSNCCFNTPGTWQIRAIVQNSPCAQVPSSIAQINVAPTAGDPALFGSNSWNVYAYKGSNFNNYYGFYTETSLNFNSIDRWASAGSPSQASGYQGCTVPVDNHSVIYKRQGFPCGYYRLDIPNHDDGVTVFVDGVEVFQHPTGGASHTGIWSGLLNSSSTIEYRWQETTGGSNGALAFVNQTIITGGSIGGTQSVCSGSTPTPFTNNSAPTGNAGTLTYQWQQQVGCAGLWADIPSASNLTYTVTSGLTQTTCYRRATTDACGFTATSNTITVTVNENQTVAPAVTLSSPVPCGSGTVTFTATQPSGSNSNRWYSASSGGTLLHEGTSFSVAISGPYTVYVSSYNSTTGCESTTRTVASADVSPIPGNASASSETFCEPTTTTLTATAGTDGTTVKWYNASTGGTLLHTGTTYPSTHYTSTTTYHITSFNTGTGCESSSRVPVTVTIQPQPGIPSITGAESCGPDTLTLSAVPGANGNDIKWYSDSTTGTSFHSGTDLTDYFAGTQTFWVSTWNTTSDCEGERVQITATINPIPDAPQTQGAAGCGSGTATLYATPGANGNNAKWYSDESGGVLLNTGTSFSSTFNNTETFYVSTVDTISGCESSTRTPVKYTSHPVPSIVLDSVKQVSCFGGNDGLINISITGGTALFDFSWSNGATTEDIFGLEIGNYSVTVTDANGCTVTATYSVSEPSVLTATLASANDFNGYDISCNSGKDGAIDLAVNGGVSPYSYLWSDNSTDSVLTGVGAGTYNVTVTDDNRCSAVATITLTEPDTLTAAAIVTSQASCSGSSDGSASVTANGGILPYSYLWTNGSTVSTATGLSAGIHTVTVTDANGCEAIESVTITDAELLTATASASTFAGDWNVSCNGASDGTATVTVIGGTAPFSYIWSNDSTNVSVTGLSADTYSVTVTDNNGCTITASVTLTEPDELTASANATAQASCNGASDGSASVTVNGGSTPYSYIWTSGSILSTATGLSAGLHTVTVTDANGCESTSSVTITQPDSLTASVSAATFTGDWNVSCNGASDGSASVTVNGGTVPYSYNWSNDSTTASISGLSAGIYTVTVTDANGCETTASVTLTEPDELAGTISAATFAGGWNVSCNGATDGSAGLTVEGGTQPYSYAWDNNATSEDLSSLGAGTYSVTVTDANGCETTASVTLTEPDSLSASISADEFTGGLNISCNGASDGTAIVSVSGGTAPFSYIWTGGTTSAVASGLAAGTYTVTVTDDNGCETTASITLTEPDSLTANASVVSHVSCKGGSDGSASVTVNGGITPYSYNWSSGSTSNSASNLSAGIHTVTVTDANGCETTSSVTLTEPDSLTATAIATAQESCNGASNGSASVTANGGTTPYSYVWSNDSTTSSVSGLSAGEYTVTVTDANGCETTASVIITQPEPLTASIGAFTFAGGWNVSCNGASDGSATVSVNGGTAPFSYIWSNDSTNATVTGLTAGIYSVTVTDANGCETSTSVTFFEPDLLTSSATAATYNGGWNVSCNGASDGSATVTVNGGTAPFSYIWSNDSTGATASDLSAGSYSVTVTDANGCETTASVTLTEPDSLTASVSAATFAGDWNVSCNGASDGSAIVTVLGGTVPFHYSWSNDSVNQTVSGLSAGTYSVTVTDANGCEATATVTLSEPLELVLESLTSPTFVGGNNVSCNGATDGSATVVISGGTENYDYSWSNGQTTSTAVDLGAGSHSVTVTDANGCSGTSSITLTEPDALWLTISNDTIVYFGFTQLECVPLSVTGSGGGIAPYTFEWSTGDTTENITVCPSTSTTYSVTITDANGCTEVESVDVLVYDVHCGSKGDKVEICITTPSGNLLTQCVDENAVASILAGNPNATLGACNQVAAKMAPDADTKTATAKDNLTSKMTVYPNPSTGNFRVLFTNEIPATRFVVTDISGRVVREHILDEPQAAFDVSVDLSEFTDGFYMINVMDKGQILKTGKIIKKSN